VQTRSGTATCGVPSDPVELFYEDLGDPAHPAVLLIMGIGAQLPMWPDGFCARLVDRGYRVIRYDHRDIGLSTKMTGRAAGPIALRLVRYAFGRTSAVPYTLVDMACDATGLLDHLGISRAHVVGASMGGMIAQVLAGTHPERVASLALVMTGSGRPLSAVPRWRVVRMTLGSLGKAEDADARLAREVRNIAVINGPNYLPSDAVLRSRVEQLRMRSDHPQGEVRQFDAILGTGSLLRYTRDITAPTVVVHGSHDPLMRPRNGRHLARVIDGARYIVVDGMGHDLPEPVWRPVIDSLIENINRAAG
jgi:pimeloyl-ACP methyl ester carboxylesterase